MYPSLDLSFFLRKTEAMVRHKLCSLRQPHDEIQCRVISGLGLLVCTF